AGDTRPGGFPRVPACLAQVRLPGQGPCHHRHPGEADRRCEPPGPVRRRDGAYLAGVLPRGRDDDPPRRRALPDVRVAGVARDLHRGVPGPRLMAPLTGTSPARPDTEVVFDPATYTGGVPFEALARLRRETPVAWVPEIPVLGWPEGPGFWLVLGHADVESVLRRPELFSSALGATQIRDPATPEALSYVRRMMLNMDPP